MEIKKNILEILQCPECGEGHILQEKDRLFCDNCHTDFSVRNGIPDMQKKNPMPLPKIYNNPHYIKWVEEMWANAHDYFYQPKGLMQYLMNSGHRNIKKMRGSKEYNMILDLGCGDGIHCKYLDSYENYIGLDMDRNALEKLVTRYPGTFATLANGYYLPIRDASVDCIMDIYNLEHMVYLDIALQEIERVLIPGGDIFLSIPTEGGFLWRMGKAVTASKHFTTGTFDYNQAASISHINCIWQIDKAFRRHFKIIKRVFSPFGFPSFHTNVIITYHCKMK